MKLPERTVFWDEEKKTNVDPLQGIQGGVWGVDWDIKVSYVFIYFVAIHHFRLMLCCC